MKSSVELYCQRDGLYNSSPFRCTVKRAVHISLSYNVIHVHLVRYGGNTVIQFHCELSITITVSFNLYSP